MSKEKLKTTIEVCLDGIRAANTKIENLNVPREDLDALELWVQTRRQLECIYGAIIRIGMIVDRFDEQKGTPNDR